MRAAPTRNAIGDGDLGEGEQRFRLVAEVTGEAIWDNDLTSGIQEWDGATEALFGYPARRGRTGEWWEDRVHPEDRPRVFSGLHRVLEGAGEVWEEEYRFRRADGSYARVVDRGIVVRDGAGRPVRMVGAMADVTERRRQEQELRRSEELFRATFEAAAVGIAHVAPDGRWLRINEKLCEISGYARKELLGMGYLALFLPEDLEPERKRVGRLLAGETDSSYSVERRFIKKDGSRVWVDLSVSLARAPSREPDYLTCVVEDVTDRKILEFVPDALTLRETPILEHIVAGQRDSQIAAALSFSLGTVKRDVRCILAKLGVENRRQAAVKALDIGLVSCSP